MNTLTRKLLRTIKTTSGQFWALAAIVTLGVMIYIGMSTAYYNLNRSQQQFYQDNRFADYYFQVIKAPESVIARIEAVPGVAEATGRLQKDVPIIKEDHERATGRLTGYTIDDNNEINRLQLLSGQWFQTETSGSIGVLLDPQYAQANHLQPGNNIEVIADERKVALTVIGTGTSPEFVYPMRDAGTIIPEPERFGIIMIPQQQAQQILSFPGQINQVLVDLAPGADEALVRKQVEDILEPFGNIASYPRKDQLSHAALQAELDGLRINSRFLPLIFFLIAGAVQFVILSRLIKSQRLSIGVMKAMGYGSPSIIWHYTSYALVVSMTGTVLGTLLGVGLASVMSSLYALYFNLPQTIGGLNTKVVIYSFAISMLIGSLAGLSASRSVTRISPAEAMRPEPPVSGRHMPLESWNWLWKNLNSSWKMSLRSIFRNRVRFAVTVLGVMSSVVLLVLSSFTNDAVDFLLNQNFHQVNRYDYMVRFTEPTKYTHIMDWNRWDEVQRIEPVVELPVKIRCRDRTADDLLTGMEPAGTLKRIYDKDGFQRTIPEEGVMVSQKTADKLGLAAGDMVEVETTLGIGPARISELKVVGINQPMSGAGSYVSLATANHLLGETGISTAVLLKLDDREMPVVEKRLLAMNGVSSVTNPSREQESFLQMMDSMIYFIAVMVLMAGLLGLAIVYNTSVMTFQERKRELASLRVLGFSRSEVAGLLRKETWIQASLGILIGLPAGKALGAAYVASVNTDFFSLPAIIYPRTYILAAAAALVFVWIGQQLAIRKVRELDMVEALKNRD